MVIQFIFIMEDNQQEFISWLAGKLEAQDEEDLKQKVKELGDEGIKAAYDQFLTDNVQSRKDGGKIQYIKCLQEFKKGGKMGCGCGGMKLSLKKEKGGTVEPSFNGKAVKGLNPKKVIMGQGIDGVLGAKPVVKRQTGGKLVSKPAANAPKGDPAQAVQALTPEQVQEQKVDKKVLELQGKNQPKDILTPMDILMEQVRPKQIKAKPEKQIKLYIKEDSIFGVEK